MRHSPEVYTGLLSVIRLSPKVVGRANPAGQSGDAPAAAPDGVPRAGRPFPPVPAPPGALPARVPS